MQYLAAAFAAVLATAPVAGFAAKTDNVTLVNGNVVTGEVKALEFGSLRYSTDSMGTVRIDWEDIVRVTSRQMLQVELNDGTRYFGSLSAPEDDFHVRILTAEGDFSLPMDSIVRITPIDTDERFVDRLDGSFSFGLQSQKSSEVTTSSVHADVSYRTRKYLVGLDLESTITDQPSEDTTASQGLMANYQRFRGNRWYTDWFASWERNDELGIAARTSAGGAVGRYLLQSNKNLLSIAAGVQGARSNYTGVDASETQAEGRVQLRYQRRSLVPESSFTFTSRIFPLLEDLGRFRAEADVSFRREIVEDFFLEFEIGYDYVSDSATGAANSDYTMTTSVGYSF